jgi:hypothetical protein
MEDSDKRNTEILSKDIKIGAKVDLGRLLNVRIQQKKLADPRNRRVCSSCPIDNISIFDSG